MEINQDLFRSDIQKAISLLIEIGCSEVYIFGSAVHGDNNLQSDIDFAVRGCPADKFYYAVGKLLSELNHSIDLIDLDRDHNFGKFLIENGELVRVA